MICHFVFDVFVNRAYVVFFVYRHKKAHKATFTKISKKYNRGANGRHHGGGGRLVSPFLQ